MSEGGENRKREKKRVGNENRGRSASATSRQRRQWRCLSTDDGRFDSRCDGEEKRNRLKASETLDCTAATWGESMSTYTVGPFKTLI